MDLNASYEHDWLSISISPCVELLRFSQRAAVTAAGDNVLVKPTAEFKTAKELLDYFINDDRFKVRSYFDATMRGINGFIFRGQRDITKALLPSAHRAGGERLFNFTPQPPSTATVSAPDWGNADRRTKCMTLMQWLHAEIRAIQLFLDQADELGRPNTH